jgi:hypothetical protein
MEVKNMETQQILALLVCLFIGVVGGYAYNGLNVATLDEQINGLKGSNELLETDVTNAKAVSADLKNDLSNLENELESNKQVLLDKESVLESKETAITDLKNSKALVDQRLEELELKLALIKEEAELETAGPAGAVFDEIELNYKYSTPYKVDYYDLDKLYNGEILFDGDKYYARETFTADVLVKTSLLDNEFEGVYLTNGIDAYVYTYEFDSPVDLSNLCDDNKGTCDVSPLTINFLGKEIEIVKVTSDKITAREGEMKYVRLGETVEIDGKTLKLTMLGEDFVYVEVNGETKYIKVENSKTVGGLDVYVNSIGTVSSFEGAVLVLGSDVYREYEKNSDDFGDDYKFSFEGGSNYLKSMSITYEPEMVGFSDDFVPLKTGDSLNFLDYLTLSYNGINEIRSTSYELEFRKYSSSVDKTVKIETESETIKIKNDRVTEFYFDGNVVYYEDINGIDKQGVITDVTFENGDTKTVLGYDTITGYLSFDIDGETIEANVTGFESLGTKDTDEPKDVIYTDSYSSVYDIGSEDNSIVTNYGTIIDNPETNSENDKVVLKIPDKQVTAEFSVM